MITDEDKEKVRQATDIVALVGETVELRQRGQEFWGCCPFHHEKSPSFKVNPATGLYHCFGCGTGGDVFSYVMAREHLEFPDSIRYLADRAGIELTEERTANRGPRKNRLIECMTEAEAFYEYTLMRVPGEGPDEARAYFGGRGFGSAVCRDWHLGYAPGHSLLVKHLRDKGFSPQEMYACDLARERNGRPSDRFYERVMFPIHDEMGRTIAFGGRILGPKREGVGKYVNTGDTAVFNKRKHLFAYDRAKETMAARGVAIVCEGYTDVIAMHRAGFTNAVAALGTALTADHIKLMERQRVGSIICMFDGDAAGQRAAERAIQFIDKTDAALRCVVLPNGQDPMEYLADHTPEQMQAELDASRPLMEFVFEKRLAGYDLTGPGRRVRALDEMAQVLAPLKHSVLLHEYATRLADALGMDVEETKRIIREKPLPKGDDDRRGSAAATAPAATAAKVAAYDEDDAPIYDDTYVPYDEEDDAASYAVTSAAFAPLSGEERTQYAYEVELLALLAACPDAVRPYGERLATFCWVDARHEAMAWAMLATPEGSSPAELVAAATAVEGSAPQILSSGRVASEQDMGSDEKTRILVDTLEYFSCRRRIRQVRGELAAGSSAVPDESTFALLAEATELQKRVNALANRISTVDND